MSIDLSTTYLGLKLKNPLVIAASPMTQKLDSLIKLEEKGAAAAVFPSLFEEQIEHDSLEMTKLHEFGTDSFAEALSYFPEEDDYHVGPESYLEAITKAKQAVTMPIIASLNGTSKGGWVRYAKMMQDAGADALELNIYFIATDLAMSGRDVEARYVDLVAAVKQSVSIPLAVKVGPYFSSMGNMAKRLVDAGADGLVLFNRFLQPDFDLETLETRPKLVLSTPFEMLLPLALDRHPARAAEGLAGPDQRPARRRGPDQGPAGRGRRGHGRFHRVRRGLQPGLQDPQRAARVDGGEGVRIGRAAQGQHEPGELHRPRRLRARELHEGPDSRSRGSLFELRVKENLRGFTAASERSGAAGVS